MKLLLLSLLLSASTVTEAGVKGLIYSGHHAYCESIADVYKSLRQNVYTLSNPKLVVNEDDVTLKIDIQFLKCIKQDDQFKFIQNDNHMSATYYYPTFDENDSYTKITRKDEYKEIVAYDENINIVSSTKNIDSFKGKQTISLTIKKEDLNVNRFSKVQEKGSHYTTVFLRTLTGHSFNDGEYDTYLSGGGQWNVFIDLETGKATL